jgi:peptidoglycan/xylan/chitin deacetylase (PgdA/CDA1 family)
MPKLNVIRARLSGGICQGVGAPDMIDSRKCGGSAMTLRWLWIACLGAAVVGHPLEAHAALGECPRAGTLGVSRTVEIDTTGGPGFGMEHYKAYDFLQPKEVVLTFDDGPQKYTTEEVLKALADECVKATFFSVGKMALGYPAIIREVANAGHTVGTHTWSHKALGKLKTFDDAKDEIERGISAVHRAVGKPIAPFFRFPTLRDTPETVAYLGKRNIAMFSCDIDSFDYKRQTPQHIVKSLMERLDKRGKGILLMHDIHKRTAEALPLLLAELKAKGYRVVHLTAKAPVTTVAEYDEAIEHDAKGLPQVGAERPLSTVVHTVGGTPPAAEKETSEKAAAEPVAPAANIKAPTVTPVTAAPATPAHKSATAASEAETEPEGLATEHSAVDHVAPTNSPPPASTAAPTGNAEASHTTTSSVARTVQDGEASGSANGSVGAKETTVHGTSKSFMERAKETWRIWFGD